MASTLTGRRAGNYEIGALVGAGGMGEVYRGRDTQLNRDVAIKALLPAVAGDTERLARFNREAQVLASLNHPSIAHIHGVEQGPDGPLLVLEFVDGPTLADRIASGALPVDEAIAIAKQVADALEAAHERGVIHCDLKPANIKVDDHGTVKVLDFGLAKALDQGSGIGDQGSGSANSPTITSPAMTQAGMILGTAAYMSPEQAKGRVVDKRSDVWAFGCVLYEMLTGTRAFGGEDVTDTIAAVVRGEPDWSKLPEGTPSWIRLLLRRCLEKDRKARIADISVARFLIEEKIGNAEAAAGGSSRTALMIAATAAVIALIGAAAWTWSSGTTTAPASLVQFEIRPPQSMRLLFGNQGPTLAVAPDGSFVVYRAMRPEGGGRQSDVLMIRAWNELEARELPDTRLGRAPFISPDGRWVGFFGIGDLRKVPVAGGPAVDICRYRGAPGGASWGDDNHIVFSSSEFEGLQRVSADGGEVMPLTSLARPKRDRAVLPHVLPGSRFVLFTEVDTTVLGWSVKAVEVATGAVKTVVNDAFQAAYSATGHLVYATTTPQAAMQRQGRASLRAMRFDGARAEPASDPVTILDPIAFAPNTLTGSFGLSRDGTLVYVPELPSVRNLERQLMWVDRKGVETAIPAPLRNYGTVRLSPDGGRVVMDVNLENAGIWIWDLSRQTFAPVNRDQSLNSIPIWMPDGRRVIWSSTRAGGNPKLVVQAADGTGTAEQISAGAGTQFATSVSSDGRTVLMFGTAQSATGSFDIGTVTPSGAAADPKVIVAAPGREFGGELSPDGKWLAYHSDESGEPQVYVRPYPNTDGGRWQVSNAGGSRAAWSRNGRELFYLNREGMLMSVPILPPTGGEFSAGLPVQVLKTAYVAGRTLLGLDVRAYDVSVDGQRFLMLKEPQQDSGDAQPPRLVVVLNWGEELKAKLPTP
jgi:serine/threonine-protein kinase